MKLTEQEKQIKLAEAAGWKPYPSENVGPAARFFNGDIWFRHAESYTIATPEQLPDYFNDLNAVHELEKVLTEDRYDDYRQHLGKAVGYLWRGIFSATAAQRAEALGLTLNLW